MTQYSQGRGGNRPMTQFQKPSDDEIKQIIVSGDVELLVKLADRVGETLAEQRLTTNQIRNVFGTARQIQMRWGKPGSEAERQAYRDAILLRPKLAYFAEREKQSKGGKSEGMETLQTVLEPALKLLSDNGQPNRERFERFVELFEAIVAYHKKHGGK